MKTGIILALALALGALVSFAQGQPGGPGGRSGGPGGPGGMRGGRPQMPIVAALDVNTNGVVEAAELANASKALLKLDKDGDGRLSATELQPQRPGSNQQQQPQFTPPDGGKRPSPPIISALDADGDGALSASEIANAATALKSLDKDGDGQLSREELMPRPPGGGQGGQGGPGGPGGFGGGNPPPGE